MNVRSSYVALGSLALLSAGLCVTWAMWSTWLRLPLLGEYEVYFEAARLRAGLPLYVDLRAGADEYGPVPSHFLVVYTPVWPAILALVPDAARLPVARCMDLCLWFLTFVGAGISGAERKAGLLAALSVATMLVLLSFGASGRPDTIALACAAAGLVRVLRREEFDVPAAILLAAAPWLKPTVAAIALCTPLAALALGIPKARRGALATMFVHVGGCAAWWWGSNGAWLQHLSLSNLQELLWSREVEILIQRGLFFFPLFGLAALAVLSNRAQRCAKLLGIVLAGSTLACLVGLAKVGSSSNYWFEPCVVAVVVLGRLSLPSRLASRWPLAVGVWIWFAFVQTATVRGILDRFHTDEEDAHLVEEARRRCMPSDSVVALSDHGGVEWLLDGRPIVESYQMFFLLPRGAFSIRSWQALYLRPEARCFVRVTGLVQHASELRDTIESAYVPVWHNARGEVYVRR